MHFVPGDNRRSFHFSSLDSPYKRIPLNPIQKGLHHLTEEAFHSQELSIASAIEWYSVEVMYRIYRHDILLSQSRHGYFSKMILSMHNYIKHA